LSFEEKDKIYGTEPVRPESVRNNQQLDLVLDRDNLKMALRKVIRNGGSPGVDGMKVTELTDYLKREWPKIRRQLEAGNYSPRPIRRVSIPKPGGGIRHLGIPTALDRFIQQAILQVLQDQWDSHFSPQAVKRFKQRIREVTYRTRGRRIEHIISELRRYMTGWYAYFKIIEVRSILKELDSWIKRRLRCYLWKQWGCRGYRELRRRGVSRDLAGNTFKSAHGP